MMIYAISALYHLAKITKYAISHLPSIHPGSLSFSGGTLKGHSRDNPGYVRRAQWALGCLLFKRPGYLLLVMFAYQHYLLN